MTTSVGPPYLNAAEYSYNQDEINGPRFILPNPNDTFTKSGTITSFKIIAKRAGSFRMQIWHRGSDNTFQLTSQSPIYYIEDTSISVNAPTIFETEIAYLKINIGDCIGFEVFALNPIAVHNTESASDVGHRTMLSVDEVPENLQSGYIAAFEAYNKTYAVSYGLQLGVVYDHTIARE